MAALAPMLAPGEAHAADPLVLGNVGAPTQVSNGQGKRAVWTNAGTVGGAPIDLVATLTTSTLDHNFTTQNNRAAVTSVGQDNIWVTWQIFQAGTYNIATGTGGVVVNADIHIQLNDVDGPNNERAYVPVCDGTVRWVRIDGSATTGRDFGTVAGVPNIFSLIGDQDYNSQPISGLEVLYPNTNTFRFGRTANSAYFIRVDNPSYSTFTTLDYQCGDYRTPVAVNDAAEGALGAPVTVQVLDNDSVVTGDPSGVASEFAMQAVNLTAPGGATGVVTDANGDTIGFTVPGEGAWAYDDATGGLTFTPLPAFMGAATPVSYTFENGLGVNSNAATVSINYPAIGVTKAAALNDDVVGDGHAQVGETIAYTYTVTAFGSSEITAVTLAETGFNGSGAAPSPAFHSGDTDADGRLDPGETWIYRASYTLVAADLTRGSVQNQATASGVSTGGTPVSDLSDSLNPADGNGIGTPGPGANNDDTTVSALTSAPIDAIDDSPPAVNGASGQADIRDAFANDTLNGTAVSVADLNVSVVIPASHGGIMLNSATGMVSVAAGTPAATYTIVYQICEKLSPGNCDNATITVIVDAAAIDAIDDLPPAVGGAAGEPNLIDAFANDTLNGVSLVPANITATIVTPAAHTGVTLDTSTGIVSVAAGTPASTYTIVYRICENLNPLNCDDATVTVGVGQAVIDAVDDNAGLPVDTANAIVGALNVLTGDTVNGDPASITTVDISAAGPLPAGFTLQMHGSVDIAQGTPSGIYSFDYRICEIINPTNCDTATATVAVEKTVPAVSGTVFFDTNGNGAMDAGERRLPGYLVELRLAGVLVKATTSAADGSYHIVDFNPGAGYEIVFLDPQTQIAVGHIRNLTFGVNSIFTNQNQPIDPSGVIYNVVTGEPLAGAQVQMRTASGVRLPSACLLPGQQDQTTAADGRYRFDIVAGADALCPVTQTEYRLAILTFPAGMEPALSVIAPPQAGALDATTCPMDTVPGGACQLSADPDAPAGGAPTPYFMAFLLEVGDPNVVNNHIPLDPVARIPANGLSVTKQANVAVARRDEVVGYVIVAANANAIAAGALDVVDKLPQGFAYVDGSARLNGAAVTPAVAGRTLTFAGLRIPARGQIEIRLSARIGADVVPGDHANET
ncbi:MAG: SdrD B-like domain-containing protein, partial [Rhizobiaceae bacterium]